MWIHKLLDELGIPHPIGLLVFGVTTWEQHISLPTLSFMLEPNISR
jgi:hypothetical protein